MEKKWIWVINEKTTLGRELWARNGKEMTLDHKWKTTLSRELWALNGKEMTLGHKWKKTLGPKLWALNGKVMTLGQKWKMTLGRELRALKGTDKKDQLESGWKENGFKVVYSKCRWSDYWTYEEKYAPVSRVLTLLKLPMDKSSIEINGSKTNALWWTSEKSKLKELFMSQELLYRWISKGKSWSVYIVTHLKANLKVHKHTAHLDNSICKVINDESILSHEHLVKGSTHAPRVKPGVSHLYLNKSM